MSSLDAIFNNPRSLLDSVILPELTGELGVTVFALIIAFAVLAMLYYSSGGRWAVPAVVLTLSGSWVTSQIPAQFGGLAQSLIIVGLIAGVFAVAERFFLRPSA